MTTELTTPAAVPTTPAGRPTRRRAVAVLGAAALAAASVLALAGAGRADATVLTNCAANPISCGYPGAANTGVPAGTVLKQVPAQVRSGPGWAYNATYGDVNVTGSGAVVSGLAIPVPPVLPAETFAGIHATGHFYAGDPAGAREWVARHRDIGGVSYMALETCFGDMAKDEALQSAELLATEVMPHFA
jgi:hypothetical protein